MLIQNATASEGWIFNGHIPPAKISKFGARVKVKFV
jgi:hypothetical protein